MLQIPSEKFKEILIKQGLVTSEVFDSLVFEAKRMNQNISDVLVSRGVVNYDYVYNFLANYLEVERVNLAIRLIDKKTLDLLDEETARKKRLILFAKEPDGSLAAAMEDPGDLEIIEFLEKRLNSKIKPYLATQEDLNKGFAVYGKQLVENFKKIIEESVVTSLRAQVKNIKEAASFMPIVAIIDNLLSYAVALRASDIHIEILEETILIRFRIDGVLHEIIRIPKEIHSAIIARIKLLGGLKIDEHAKPQDGRFRHKVGPDFIDIRVAVMPVFYGEKIEMRLLLSAQRPLSLDELGIFDDTLRIIKKNIKKSYGMILICGPTGSGKSTTLYSILNILNQPAVNIVTIEDPVEYDIKYINQTQVNPWANITFANGLRAILRQDPDIIMVGEIRDEETAGIAVHSALTGHLLLSSLHTNDAVTAIPRLFDIKIVPFLVAAVLNVILAQRLVRKICLDCIESFSPNQEIIKFLEYQFKILKLKPEIKVPKTLFHGKGCLSCGETGYRGRLGIFEALDISEAIKKDIIDPNFSLAALKKTAREEGMITMFEDGLRKAEKGLTTIEEIFRVIRE